MTPCRRVGNTKRRGFTSRTGNSVSWSASTGDAQQASHSACRRLRKRGSRPEVIPIALRPALHTKARGEPRNPQESTHTDRKEERKVGQLQFGREKKEENKKKGA